MLQIQHIRENPQEIIDRLKIKNFDAAVLVDEIRQLDKDNRAIKKMLDDNLMEQNRGAKQIGLLFKEGKQTEAAALKQKMAELKESEKNNRATLQAQEELLQNKMLLLPNLPHSSVPAGKSAEDNEIVYKEGDTSDFDHPTMPHWDLVKKYDIIDFEAGNKITGTGFPVYKGKGARIQRALIDFFLDRAIEAGYHEIQPPYLVNEDSALATGQLPDKEGQMYSCELDNFYLIPTAEVPVTNLYRNVILKESDFPIKNCAYSACFRREAGSYGKDVRGLNRVHQFDKVEIVTIEHPDRSYKTLDEMVGHAKGLLTQLELPYRVVRLCGGDLSFTSALTYDLEVYAKAQQKWLEVSSVSNFETYQANRLKLRFRNSTGKMQLAHTLNGSALALPRVLAAILENNQTDKGIIIPEALRPYTHFNIID